MFTNNFTTYHVTGIVLVARHSAVGGKVNTDSAFIGFALIEAAYFRFLSIRKDLWCWKDQTNYNLQHLTVVFDVDDYVAFMIFWYVEGLVKSAGFSYLACVKILAPPIIHVLGKLFNLFCVLPHLTMCKVVENSNLCLLVLLKNEIWAFLIFKVLLQEAEHYQLSISPFVSPPSYVPLLPLQRQPLFLTSNMVRLFLKFVKWH